MVGQTISHYKILEKIGEGGMGVVYRAEDTKLHRAVALKFLRSDAIEEEELNTRFRHEAEAAASLDHSNICTVYEIDEGDGQLFLAMAFVDGQSLKEAIAERPLKLDVALDLAIQIAEGLSAAHEAGIVHRDIKPGNILLNRRRQAKILDFGLAHLGAATQITKTGTIIGTPAYMSPEQVRGEKADRRTDVWSLGVVIYEMLTGRLPFQGESGQAVALSIQNELPEPLTALRSGLPTEVDRIVEKALAKDPANRYQHVEDLLVDLRRLKQESDSGSLSGVSAAAKPRHISPALPAAIILSAVAVLAGVWLWTDHSAPVRPEAEMSIVPLTTYPGREDNPAFSPDGTQVAFDGNVEDQSNTDIYVRMVGSAGLSRLTTDPAADTSPRWSPDGRSIAFLRERPAPLMSDLMLIPAIGGPERKIAEIGPFGGALWPSYFDWAPDGTHLAVATRASVDDPLSLYVKGGAKIDQWGGGKVDHSQWC